VILQAFAPVVRGALSALDRQAGPRVSVMIFHRVLPEVDPLFPHEMVARQFDAMLAVLARNFRVMTLGQAHAHWAAGTLPARTLVITFDDGYADNAEVAVPLLQKHGLAATFFVATGFLDGGRMWNDSVIEALRRCRLDSVDLECVGLGRVDLRSIEGRRAAIAAVLPIVKYRSLRDRQQLLASLLSACGNPGLPDDLMMCSSQVSQLHAGGMEIGGHTVHHPILTELPDGEAMAEIEGGRRYLQQLTEAPVDVFAYPNGQPQRDYDRRHVEMLGAAGFRCAVSTAVGVVRPGAADLEWPRFTPWGRAAPVWGARLLRVRYKA
jgi:peptidoglycan/xylan/chitin deacetylase (PgdA/CDA1 family)